MANAGGSRIFPKEPAPPLAFEVRKGDVLYLGNLHARATMGRGMLFGPPMAISAVPVVVDERDQDIALAESKTPGIKGKVRVALLRLGPWVNGSGTLQQFDPVPMPVAPKK